MPSILISRKSEYANRARKYKIYIDDVLVDKISNGEMKKITVEQGVHKVRATIDWCSSPEVTVDVHENETTELELSSFKLASYLPFALVIVIFLHFGLSKFMGNTDYLLLLIIPVLLVMVYYMSLGRKKYLRLEQVPYEQFS